MQQKQRELRAIPWCDTCTLEHAIYQFDAQFHQRIAGGVVQQSTRHADCWQSLLHATFGTLQGAHPFPNMLFRENELC